MANFEETISTPSQNITSSQSGKVYIDDAQDRLVAYDGVNNLAVFGKDDAGNTVVKVAKPGFNANNATDAQLVFNSSQNIFKIVRTGSSSRAVPNLASLTTDTLTVPHGQPFVPAVFAYLNGTGSTHLTTGRHYNLPHILPITVGAEFSTGLVYNFEVDATNIYFTVANNSPITITDLGTANWKWYVMQETAS